MTNRTDDSGARRLICWRCGREFACDPLGACWCKAESVRLPMPVAAENCLCRDCLREAAGVKKSS
jgi:ribosomal protein S14